MTRASGPGDVSVMHYASRVELIRDWLLAPAPLADTAVVPEFDPVAALAAAQAARREDEKRPWSQKKHVRFLDVAVRPGMGAAEALFWLRVAADLTIDGSSRGYAWQFHPEEALARYPEPTPGRDELEARVVAAIDRGGEAVGAWLLPLIGLRQLVEWVMSGKLLELARKGGNWNLFFMEWMGARLPGLVRRSEWLATLAALDEHLDIADWYSVSNDFSGRPYRAVRPAWEMAIALGHTEPLRALVESWPDDCWEAADWPSESGLRYVCGARDPDFSRRHLVRLRLKPAHAAEAAIWLLHTEDTLLGPVLELARGAANQGEAREIVQALGEIGTDKACGCLLGLAHDKSAAQAAAHEWVVGHGARMLTACVRLWLEGATQAGLAKAHLLEAWKGAERAAVEAALLAGGEGGAGAELVAAWRREERDEMRLEDLPPGILPAGRLPPLPDWLRPESLADLKCGAKKAGKDVVARLLAVLRGGGTGHGLARWARDTFTPESREAFWQTLVAEWELAGTGKKDAWCMGAAVALRGAATAGNLARFITTWPAESQHQKAAQGLECLRAMGDAPALQALVSISQRTRFAGLRARAERCVAEIAAELGLTTDELADTSVPACGLDASSRREFVFRGRRLIATLERGGALVLRDESGKVLKSPPKPGPGAGDDASAHAAKEWSAFKKQVGETVKTQRQRLELALAGGRRWTCLSFEHYIVAHPVLRTLAATLVWARFDAEGMVRSTFTPGASDEGAATGAETDGRPAQGDEANVGLVHPLQLDEAEATRWADWARALGCEQAVEQLGRAAHRVPESEAGAVAIMEFAAQKISGATLRRRMDGMAWRRGIPVDAGLFYEYARPFPAAGITAIVETSGQSVVTGEDFETVEVRRVFFVPGLYEPVEYSKHDTALPLGYVDAIAYSETVRAMRTALRNDTRAA